MKGRECNCLSKRVSNTYLNVEKCVFSVYNIIMRRTQMKQRDLIKKLEAAGFEFLRHGGNHDIYKRGDDEEKIPRHREVNERLAKAILRKWGL